jgi:class 3 adenylate cyclase
MSEPARAEPRDEDVARVLDECVQHVDGAIRKALGRPLIFSLIAFPSRAHELAAFASNIEPERRAEIAQALIELLVRWGYIAS